MTIQEKKRFLQRYKQLDNEINSRIDELAHWKSAAEKVTPTYSCTPSGTPDGNKIEVNYEKIEALSKEINEMIDELVDLKAKIEDAINKIGNENFRLVLKYHYIDGKTLEEVADILYYSRVHVCRLHGYALLQIKL